MNEPQNDPAKPNLIWARKPVVAPDWSRLVAHPRTFQKWVEMKAWTKIGEYAGLVHGSFALTSDGEGVVGTRGLLRPVAIFRGLRRPLHDGLGAGADRDVLIYVTNPPHSYTYEPRHQRRGLPEVIDAPQNCVFTTCVSFKAEYVDAASEFMPEAGAESPQGSVLFWEWTEASRVNPRFPYEYDSRYEERLL